MFMYGSSSSITLPLESRIQINVDIIGKERKMRVCHEASKILPAPPQKCELQRFFENTSGRAE